MRTIALRALAMFDDTHALPAPILPTLAVYVIAPTLLLYIYSTTRRFLQVFLSGVLSQLFLIVCAILSSILLAGHSLVNWFPTLDAVILLTYGAFELCFMFKSKCIGTSWCGAPSDSAVFIKSFVERELTELLILVLWHALFNVLVSHLFATPILRAENLEFVVSYHRLNVFLEAFFVEYMFTLS
jgi:hypothetical protein